MIHIKRNICLVAVSCTLLAGIPLQGVAQTGRTAKVQATQSNKITVSGTVLDKTTNDPLIGVSVVVKGVANDEDFVKGLYEKIVESDIYKEYMASSDNSYEYDRELWRKLYKTFVFNNEALDNVDRKSTRLNSSHIL